MDGSQNSNFNLLSVFLAVYFVLQTSVLRLQRLSSIIIIILQHRTIGSRFFSLRLAANRRHINGNTTCKRGGKNRLSSLFRSTYISRFWNTPIHAFRVPNHCKTIKPKSSAIVRFSFTINRKCTRNSVITLRCDAIVNGRPQKKF